MPAVIFALLIRIFSNPFANSLQKILSVKYSAILINLYSYAFLSLLCVYPAVKCYSWSGYGIIFWEYVCLAGILCTLGSVCLIKALQCGEMSMLGPINSYKCIVGLLLAAVMLGEIPTGAELFGVLFIISGSWYIFDTVDGGFKFSLLLRRDIILRFAALFFTGCEAVILKKIILMSSFTESFILWCFSGLLFSLVLIWCFKIKFTVLAGKNLLYTFFIALGLGMMQLSTNFVFDNMDVGLSLALFQLSSIVSVVFGWKFFCEKNVRKKLLGALIMIIGSCFILIR